jgi:sugar phosphate isomerase/epimerase
MGGARTAERRVTPLRLAVSNIAWAPVEDDAVAELLRAEGVSGVEIAPTKWRDKPLEATAAEVAAYRRAWADRGLRIVSLQALLFGRPDLELFGETRSQLAEYLQRTIELGAGLGAHALVFGSPKNRLRDSLTMTDAMASAAEFFRDIGDFAAEHGVVVAIEANPPEYGCDFVTRTSEAVALCRAIASPGIGVNGDLGGMTMCGDEPRATLEAARGYVAHFHASEPNLAELGGSADHAAAAAGLRAIGYDGWVSIEMRAAAAATMARATNVLAVERAVRLAKSIYGGGALG